MQSLCTAAALLFLLPTRSCSPRLLTLLPAPRLQTCHGSGVEMKLRALGPGMVQQIQQRCSRCGGGGYACPPADKCGQCDGKGLAPEKKVFEVRAKPCCRCRRRCCHSLLCCRRCSQPAAARHKHSTTPPAPHAPPPCPPPRAPASHIGIEQVHIEPGHRHGSKVVFRGEAGSDSPDVLPGDLIFILEQKEHGGFKRIGTDLFFEKSVSLVDALCGERGSVAGVLPLAPGPGLGLGRRAAAAAAGPACCCWAGLLLLVPAWCWCWGGVLLLVPGPVLVPG